MTELRNAHKSPAKSVENSRAKIGDVVLVHGENHPRSYWRTGRISDLVSSTVTDGQSRGAVVQVTNKKGKVATLRHPLQLLYPLEINCELAEEERNLEQESKVTQSADSERPRRRAAIAGEQLIRNWIKDMNEI